MALVLATAAASIPGAAAGRGIALSASPLRLRLEGASRSTVVVRNPGRRALLVKVTRAGFARSPRGAPRVRPARRAAGWLHLSPRRFRIAPGGTRTLHVVAAPPRRAAPGDHPALVLLTTRPLGVRRVRVRLRVGVVVDLRVRGRIVRRLEPQALTVRRRGAQRILELRLVNRGNVTERLDNRVRLVLRSHGRAVARLRPRRRGELLPHSAGIVTFVYAGPVRGRVRAQVELRRAGRRHLHAFWIRL
ncbi:MAG TPA: hypothetical protein VE984_08125 [Gaiellaceae bacterium]|nr:hypothetical protein [Gaiellaceae bacterium]